MTDLLASPDLASPEVVPPAPQGSAVPSTASASGDPSGRLPATRGVVVDPDAHRHLELPPPIPAARRVWKDRRLMHHNRLAAMIALANLVVLVRGVATGWFAIGDTALGNLADLAAINVAVAVLARQHYVINLVFTTAASAPTSWPLRVRAMLGKVYHVFGGVHVGAAVSGSVWFALLLVALGVDAVRGRPAATWPVVLVSVAVVALLAAMIVTALPRRRAARHDLFERTHRFAGWTVLALFWLHTALLATALHPDEPLLTVVRTSISAQLLVVVTISIALPWLRLRRVPVQVVTPSNHVAIATFDYGVTPFAGSSTTISRNPLLEWHSFANIPAPGRDGYRLAISRSGDWTGDFIEDPPDHVWVKAFPTAGVGHVEKLFKRVVWVATGSGIGPTLPHLLTQRVPSRLIWATRDPRSTYGDGIVDEILAVQPDALIWDTDALGKPDMVRLTLQAVRDFDAEAVICISNKSLTWQVVEGMERLGIPAFGAIFDS